MTAVGRAGTGRPGGAGDAPAEIVRTDRSGGQAEGTTVPRGNVELDRFERAVAFAIREAAGRHATRTITVIESARRDVA